MSDNNENNLDITQRGLWSSRLMFILAAAGSAIGLGNIWKFPYIAGKYGGGAFVLFYLLCIALIGVPVLVSEILIGRQGRKNPVGSFKKLSGGNPMWMAVGFLGVASGFVILSYYSVVAGWSIDFIWKSAGGSYIGAGPEAIDGLFTGLIGDWKLQLGWHTLFMVLTVGIVIFGVREGLERWIGILMPLLFVLLIVMVIYGLVAGDAVGGLKFLFKPNWDALFFYHENGVRHFTARPMLEAMGHAFFTLSLGMGAMITYGSYLGDDEDLAKSAIMVAVLDTVIAIFASIAIFTILFAHNPDLIDKAGPGLVFYAMPLAFSEMWGGRVIGTAFFTLLSFAALTSGISLLEVVVAYFIDDRKWKRRVATLIMGAVIWGLGIFSALSFNVLEDWKLMPDKAGNRMSFFDSVDLLATNYMLPIGGFFIALFAGWFVKKKYLEKQLLEGGGSESFYRVWSVLVKYVTPVLVFVLILFMVDLHLGFIARITGN